ncbi:DNA-(apurinic or apyrimidinic site) endonuclease 2-like isoform X2 [Babylonia areolata]|uniref:DNA-(apurinic or apyrimidinic site) endonuclease 2-like isoform X2 n=1 Tax=Babylonia areolata TaxID=304850 RepID=UPI003FD28603
MKILTWNINGDMLDEPSAIAEGYNAYFSFSRKRSGYSGTANFCRHGATPCGAEEGLSGQLCQAQGDIGCWGSTGHFTPQQLRSLDGEGRAVLTQHQIEVVDQVKDVVIINVYVPRAAEREDRWTYKLHFLALLQARAESLLRCGRHVIVLGDINTTHKRIDHCDPSSQEFLRADSRQWLDQFLRPEDRDPDLAPIEDLPSFEAVLSDAEGGHFIDAFRFFHPQQTEAYTNWSTLTAARQTNYGKRLDYILVDRGLEPLLEDCRIVADFEGSDHCPVVLQLRCLPLAAPRCPPLCTSHMPEFLGRQQKLIRFFSTHTPHTPPTHTAHIQSKGGNPDPSLKTKGDGETVPPQTEREASHKSSPQKTLKRTRMDNPADNASRKKRGKGENSAVASGLGSKQGSLLNFFHRPPAPVSTTPPASTSITTPPASTTLCGPDCSAVLRPPSPRQQQSDAQCTSQYWGVGGEGDGQTAPSLLQDSGSSKPSPTSTQQDVGSSKPSPTSTQQDVGSSKPSPISTQQDVGSSKPSPISTQQDVGRSKPSPISTQQDVGSSKPSPTSTQQDVGSSKPSPTSTQQDVGSSKPSPSSTQQDVGSSKPSPPQEDSGSSEPGSVQGQAGQEPQARARCVWRSLLSGPPRPPLCRGHGEPCVLRTVKKAGPTRGKQFYVCARPQGHSSNKEARCNHFQWVTYMPATNNKP